MEKWNEILNGLAKNAGAVGVQKLNDAIDGVAAESQEPWKKAVISLMGDAIDEYGLDGINKVADLVKNAIDGKGVDLEFASLKTRSDFLAAMQVLEAEGKAKVMELIQRIGSYIATLVRSILAGL